MLSLLAHYQCTKQFVNAEHTALSNKNDSLLICRYLVLTNNVKPRSESEKQHKSILEDPLVCSGAGFQGSRGAAHAGTQDSPTTPRSECSRRRHAAPRSPHSEVAFMWKAGASQHAAKKRVWRMG